MTNAWTPPAPSALDDTPWPDELTARAVQPDSTDDRLHGYAVVGDLARHYRYSDLLFVAIHGETPSTEQSALFDVALFALATPNVGESPVHLAVLTRLSGAPLASAMACGLVAAADQARAMIETHTALLDWFAAPTNEVPVAHRGDDAAWIDGLRQTVLHRGARADLLRSDMTRDAARVSLLWLAGLHSPDEMQAAIVAARIGAIAAEAMATGPHHLGAYPVKLPPFHYVEDARK